MDEKVLNNEVEEIEIKEEVNLGTACDCDACSEEDYECVSSGFFRRLFSKVMDWVIVAFLSGLALVAWNFVNGNILNAVASKMTENDAAMEALTNYNTFAQGSAMALIIIAVTVFVYYFVTGSVGATLGERTLGIEVVGEDCFLLTKGKVACRTLIRVVVELLPLAYIAIPAFKGFNTVVFIATFIPMVVVYLFAAFTADKQGLHDMAVGAFALKDE